nr:uncharacterized protein I203_03319 [Kwoniella mangroviensis CBS 8507]OCF67622.1 hypothetical protein I203_03319 [Kwoniella mangroviensis CBS 8507]
MSFVAHERSPSSSGSEEEKRAQRLASAKKKVRAQIILVFCNGLPTSAIYLQLQTYRASRSSENSDSTPMVSSSSSSSKPPSPTKMMPLTTEASINSPFTFPQSHSRSSSKSKGKDIELDQPVKSITGGHRHKRSDSQAHRRQRSSIAISSSMTLGQGLSRPSVMGVFDGPKEIITTPATPLLDSPDISPEPRILPDENHEEVAARLSTFSFGSKPPMSTFPPKRRQQQPLLSSQSLFSQESFPSTSPLASPTSSASAPNLNRLSTPSSRPPSFLLTHPTPLAFGSPTPSNPAASSLASLPSSPPTPARKRHSHTRSNSISLPNLKLSGARPTSLGIPPSIPSSPCSPTSVSDSASRSRLSSPITGQRLKFEPSGRGAEAEKERQESRRKALEKLTGGPSAASRSPIVEPQVAEISLPDLDDEDSSSVASSNRPLSGAFGSGSGSNFFSRPSSLTLPSLTASTTSSASAMSSSTFSWGSPNDQQSPVERWSGFGFGLAKEYGKDDGMNFGMDLSTAMAKRPSINRQLSALAEVDESEEDEGDFADNEAPTEMVRTFSDEPESIISSFPVEPTPSRLRELRLRSSISSSTPRQESMDSVHSFSFPRQSSASPSASSPTKGYGSIGRGRPKPLTIGSTTSTPSNMSTPKSAGFSSRKRTAPGSGSRGSSISYKKDDSSSSSHDLSIGNGRNVFSPESVTSPPLHPTSPKFSGWGSSSASRSTTRPCPRPRTLVGLGIDNTGSGRVLGELDGVDEENSPIPGAVSMWTSPIPDNNDTIHPYHDENFGIHDRRDSFADEATWRDVQLDMEMEREALKEDVELLRNRCASLEETLEMERKESTVLRERVRKLGDRLSSVSSVPTDRSSSDSHAAESRLIAEMREQLFNLTTSLEAERRAKEAALTRLAEIQRPAQPSPLFDVAVDNESVRTAMSDHPVLLTPSIASPVITPPSPLAQLASSPPMEGSTHSTPDPNLARMKGWGFPRDPSPVKSNQSKRESFFGLSTVLKRSVSADEAETHNGVDLPCFVLPDQTPTSTTLGASSTSISFSYDQKQQDEYTPRSVSEPITKLAENPLSEVDTEADMGFTNSAVSFISSYLPKHSPSLDLKRSDLHVQRYIGKDSQLYKVSMEIGELEKSRLDFRGCCKCCTGTVIEL